MTTMTTLLNYYSLRRLRRRTKGSWNLVGNFRMCSPKRTDRWARNRRWRRKWKTTKKRRKNLWTWTRMGRRKKRMMRMKRSSCGMSKGSWAGGRSLGRFRSRGVGPWTSDWARRWAFFASRSRRRRLVRGTWSTWDKQRWRSPIGWSPPDSAPAPRGSNDDPRLQHAHANTSTKLTGALPHAYIQTHGVERIIHGVRQTNREQQADSSD